VGDSERDDAAQLERVRGLRIAIVGYGNQGRAQALNLRDSGCDVRVGLPEVSQTREVARQDGFAVDDTTAVSSWADLIAILAPDQVQGSVYTAEVRECVHRGDTLLFSHGFSLRFGQIAPPPDVDVVLVAPVGPGHTLRRLFLEGFGIPAVWAVQQDASGSAEQTAVSYATALGCARAGIVKTTIEEETEIDLFGEQAVLCGGLSHLIKAGYATLVKAGYQPDLAYFECVHQVKLIVDLIYDEGIAGMHRRISDTAKYGDYVSGPRVIGTEVREAMEAVLEDIRDGSFARRWLAEVGAGMPLVERVRAEEERSDVEAVGNRLRAQMGLGRGEQRDESA
jgi:ketol-acid reductoisomerase